MRHLTPERRGTYAALTVAVTIGVLLLVLQPGAKPARDDAQAAPEATTTSTSTIPPGVRLCTLAKQFVRDAATLDANGTARVAETFYDDASKLVEGATRAEFDATARYYAEYNDIGQTYDYDVFRIAAAGKGDRWSQLIYRPPLGIETARASVKFACQVDLPPPPTSTTIADAKDPLEDLRSKSSGATGARGDSGATGGSGTTRASGATGTTATTPTSGAAPATTAR